MYYYRYGIILAIIRGLTRFYSIEIIYDFDGNTSFQDLKNT